MASPSSPPTPRSLVWSSIIETLADSKHADLPLLSGLIARVPDFYTAAPQPVRERVALRYLEECAGRGAVETRSGLAGTAAAVDVSQSAEEFLCNNLTKPIDLSEPAKATVLIGDDIRQFISQKRSALPKPSLDLLKESVSRVDAKVPSTWEDGSSSDRQGDVILEKEEDNDGGGEQEMIGSPRSAGGAESLQYNNAPQNLPSQSASGADKAAGDPSEENNPTTVLGDVSDLEAGRTDPSSDDQNQYILKRRAAVAKKSVEELEEVVPETCIPTDMTNKNENNNNKLRFNTGLPDDLNDWRSSQIPLSEQECILCNERGQLLTCSRKDCGITVHESCIQATPSSYDKEGRFYCPCCACARAAQVYARAQKHFSLAKQSLSSFMGMQKNIRQEKGEENMSGKRKGKEAEFSDDENEEDFDGVANLEGGFPGHASSYETSRESREQVENDGKARGKHVKSNDRDVSKDRDIFRGGEGSKRQEADLDKYIYTKSGPKATLGGHETVSINDRVNANANKRRRPTARYSNKVAAPRRRTALPWSEEEEQAIREGMQKFGVTDDGRVPWSTILEYGRDVFHKTRLPIDLKDKWRNIMKKQSPASV